jgi:hypothetical protein
MALLPNYLPTSFPTSTYSVVSEIRPKEPQLASTYKSCGVYNHIYSIARVYLRIFSAVCANTRKQIMCT